DLCEIALTATGHAPAARARGARARLGEVGGLRRKRGRHYGASSEATRFAATASVMASPTGYPARARSHRPEGHRCRRGLAGWRARHRVQALGATLDAATFVAQRAGLSQEKSSH